MKNMALDAATGCSTACRGEIGKSLRETRWVRALGKWETRKVVACGSLHKH